MRTRKKCGAGRGRKWEINVLLVGLPEVPVSILGLFFQKLQTALESLVLSIVLSALVGRILGLLKSGLELLDLTLQKLVPVVEGCDLLLLGEVLLLQRLDLALKLLNLLLGLLGLEAEVVHSLESWWSVFGYFQFIYTFLFVVMKIDGS